MRAGPPERQRISPAGARRSTPVSDGPSDGRVKRSTSRLLRIAPPSHDQGAFQLTTSVQKDTWSGPQPAPPSRSPPGARIHSTRSWRRSTARPINYCRSKDVGTGRSIGAHCFSSSAVQPRDATALAFPAPRTPSRGPRSRPYGGRAGETRQRSMLFPQARNSLKCGGPFCDGRCS